jgi:hypothetical protein
MGWGGFGSNGSVHWQINYDDQGPPAHSDYDDTKKHPGSRTRKSAIGGGDHPGQFRVTARYATAASAEAALQKALDRLKASGGAVVEMDVDLRPFAKVKENPGETNDWEIIVQW